MAQTEAGKRANAKWKAQNKEYQLQYLKKLYWKNVTHKRKLALNNYKKRKELGYKSFSCMKERCLNPKHKKYEYYGGRGITVCERWLGKNGWKNFLEDMGKRPEGMTIDRIDTNGNYEPSNCKWSTMKQQNRNQRSTKLTESKVATIRLMKSQTTQKEIAEHFNVSKSTIEQIHSNRTWKEI